MIFQPQIVGKPLPALTNPGTAADLLSGKQLIDANGNVLTGTIPSVVQATPSISIDGNGVITASAEQEAGNVSHGIKSSQKNVAITRRDYSDVEILSYGRNELKLVTTSFGAVSTWMEQRTRFLFSFVFNPFVTPQWASGSSDRCFYLSTYYDATSDSFKVYGINRKSNGSDSAFSYGACELSGTSSGIQFVFTGVDSYIPMNNALFCVANQIGIQ